MIRNLEAYELRYAIFGLLSALFFFGFAAACIQAALAKRLRLLIPGVVLGMLHYFLNQGVSIYMDPEGQEAVAHAYFRWFLRIPALWIVVFFLLSLAVLLLMAVVLWRLDRTRITPMSVKEAADSLPTGLCFYLPGGRVLLVNRTMEDLCRRTAGGCVVNGEDFREALLSGPCVREEASEEGTLPLLVLEDGSAWSLSERETLCEGLPVRMLTAAEVTELYQKNRSLQAMRKELDLLNRRLTSYYLEIAELTVQRELLDARVRLHDEMGTDLLLIRQYVTEGGTPAARKDIEARLERNLSFLKADHRPPERDEYKQIIEAAKRLNVTLVPDGPLPAQEPFKHVLATAMHECLTNTLRHAHGDTLYLTVRDREDGLTVVFTNNGTQPEGPVTERGGLSSLRKLTEEAGGAMEVAVDPVLTVTLRLPKEVPHAL